MDLVPLIDLVGEPGTLLIGGAVLGLLFGFAAQRSAFCTRSAVLDMTRGRGLNSLAVWLAGLATAILGIQWMLLGGMIGVSETRFFATAQSLSGALAGGLLFGVGMILARGCVSRLLVLGASGNLRAAFSILVIAVVGVATYGGVLVPLRDAIGGMASTAAIGGNDLLAHLALGREAGVALGAVMAMAAIVLAIRARVSWWRVAGGIVVGASVVGGWYFTHTLSTQVFEPIQTESLSFIRPLATTGEIALGDWAVGLDQGLLIGTIAGAFLAAVLFGQFRVATFSDPDTPSVLRYAVGSALMGFGGILAVGCTIGAGFTGGSVLAVSSLLGLTSMIAGAAVADRVIDRGRVPAPAGLSAAA